ncbi:hypothetical protein EZS27_005814 [termite gut metagenome]|uniref:Outer-membrane lipoprotein carrier protein n=1 Tax=termite gut metagenome TaxID=433724 RepID=A0A5J4SL13_9ZZZZ
MKGIFYVLLTLFALSIKAQSTQTESQRILESAAAAIRTGGGIKADFTMKMLDNGKLLEEIKGSIRLKGELFLLKTEDTVIWFDGKTQWSYWVEMEEVNVTNPTTEELQSINPYALLSAYQTGFECEKGGETSFQGKPVDEVLLTETANNRHEILRARLYITKETHQLAFIAIEQPGGSCSEITVTGYRTKMMYEDALFRFNRKEYPNAEIIDLR